MSSCRQKLFVLHNVHEIQRQMTSNI